jgi:5-hydroxyisourate hydrolase
MTRVSTHVLDAVTGRPAVGVHVALIDAGGTVLADAHTDNDGRLAGLYSGELSGTYRLRFDTAAYFAEQGICSFYPEIVIAFEIDDATAKYHVPLLLSPYAYSTYRGS